MLSVMNLAAVAYFATAEGSQLLTTAHDLLPRYSPEAALRAQSVLRARWPAPLVAEAITQVRLRERAATKLGQQAHHMLFTAQGVEQASAQPVSQWRFQRFTKALADSTRPVADVCCGNGCDALALAAALPATSVHAVDLDPVCVALTAANAAALGIGAQVRTHRGDVTALPLSLAARVGAIFCDPARREDGQRRLRPDLWSPPLAWVEQLAHHACTLAAKVAPGLPHTLIPVDAQAEWISLRGEVKEAVLWWGKLRDVGPPAKRIASVVHPTQGSTHTLTDIDLPLQSPVGPVGRYLYEPNGAVIRAGLVGGLCGPLSAHLLDPQVAYLTGNAHVPSPFATGYEVLDVLPFALKTLRAYLRQRHIGVLTIKKRAFAVEPEQLRRQLRAVGPHTATLVLTRIGTQPTVLVVRPIAMAGG